MAMGQVYLAEINNSVGDVQDKFVAGNYPARGLNLCSINDVANLSWVNFEYHCAVIWILSGVFLYNLPSAISSPL
jgi:hypothetical protein